MANSEAKKDKFNKAPEVDTNTDGEEPAGDEDIQFISDMFGNQIPVEEIESEIPEGNEEYIEPDEVTIGREKTRGVLALVFVIGFFGIILAGFLLVAFANEDLKDKATNLKDILLAISGVLSGPLGFVVGYYFRKQEQEDNDS